MCTKQVCLMRVPRWFCQSAFCMMYEQSDHALTGIEWTIWPRTAMLRLHSRLRTQAWIAHFCWPVLLRLSKVLNWHRQNFICFLVYETMHHEERSMKTTRHLFVKWSHSYVGKELAGTEKACMPLFCSGVGSQNCAKIMKQKMKKKLSPRCAGVENSVVTQNVTC